MTIAIMQPYVFPYLGYYQLVNAVDRFVFFDDVNFINKGWINRNQILQQSEPFRFTIPLIKASQNRLINEIEIADYEKWKMQFLKLIEFNYKKAPYFSDIYPWLSQFLNRDYKMIGRLASDSVEAVARLLSLDTEFSYSTDLHYRTAESSDGESKILAICDLLSATKYINPKNGVELYQPSKFQDRNIDLKFIHMDEIVYGQFEKEKFVPYLSIIDVLMFNGTDETRKLLEKYTLN
jgi:hypothetical protein